MNDRPERLFRVEYEAAVGWPTPQQRRIVARNYQSAAAAGRQLSIIDALPSHLRFLAAYVTECTWQQIDAAMLPRPEERETDGQPEDG